MLCHLGLLALTVAASAAKKPNFVFILTDDQDMRLGRSDKYTEWGTLAGMPSLERELAGKGAKMENFFVATPICCPSRAETFQGRYLMNIADTGATEGKANCMHADTTGTANMTGMFGSFKSAGYEVGVFGKFTNNQVYTFPALMDNKAVSFIDSADKFDDYNAQVYVHYNETNGTGSASAWKEDFGNSKTPPFGTTYQTSQIGNRSLEWVTSIVKNDKPFFMYMGPHAPHYPATPAPWYLNAHKDLRAPRTPNYNASCPDKPAHIAQNPPMTDLLACWEDEHMRDRWRTLLSVDDLVQGLVDKLTDLKVIDNTYIFYTSDHGYKLGQWRVPTSKQHPYDTDIRVPMLIRGPGVVAGSVPAAITANVDLLPTMLDLAGLPVPPQVDGKSFAATLRGETPPSWRQEFLVSYRAVGTYYSDHSKVATGEATCGGKTAPFSPNPSMSSKQCKEGTGNCWFVDSTESNTWRALRTITDEDNVVYIEYDKAYEFDELQFHEYYDLKADPYQLTNLYPSLSDDKKAALKTAMSGYWKCQGAACP